jgi:hypothetical protein
MPYNSLIWSELDIYLKYLDTTASFSQKFGLKVSESQNHVTLTVHLTFVQTCINPNKIVTSPKGDL